MMTADKVLVALLHLSFLSEKKEISGVELYGKECQTQEKRWVRMEGV